MTIEEYVNNVPRLPYDTVGAIDRGEFPSVYKTAVRKHGDWRYIMCLSSMRPLGYVFTLALHNTKTDERWAIKPSYKYDDGKADCLAQGKAWMTATNRFIKRGEMPPSNEKFWLSLYI